MMAVALCSTTNQTTKPTNLGAIFNEVNNLSQSSKVIKRLIAVAISKITYLRALCPEYAYADKCLEDLKLKILRDDTTCKKARCVVNWIRSSFEALDKQYLRQIIFGIYKVPGDCENLIESYTFGFSYQKNAPSFVISRNNVPVGSSSGSSCLKSSAVSLIRSLIVLLQNLEPLSGDVRLVMKLLYYDDVTPPNYDPPGFKPTDSFDFNYPSPVVCIKLGQIETVFHALKVSVKSNKKQFEDNDVPDEISTTNGTALKSQKLQGNGTNSQKNSLDININMSQLSQSSKSAVKGSQNFQEPLIEANELQVFNSEMNMTTSENYSTQPLPTIDYEKGVNCSCGFDKDDGLMILCLKCDFWQHAACYKIINETEAPTEHVCQPCAKTLSIEGTDITLKSLKPSELKATCLWRRVIMACLEVQCINLSWLNSRLGIDDAVSKSIFHKLVKEKYVNRLKCKDGFNKVNTTLIKTKGMQLYFSASSTIVTSFESEPDKQAENFYGKDREIDNKVETKNYVSIRKRKLFDSSQNECGILDVKSEDTAQNQNRIKRPKASIAIGI